MEKKGDRCDAPELPASAVPILQEAARGARERWCSLVPIDQRTWAIPFIAYEGEVILAESTLGGRRSSWSNGGHRRRLLLHALMRSVQTSDRRKESLMLESTESSVTS